MENIRIKILAVVLLSLAPLCSYSQLYICDYEVTSDNSVFIKAIYNNDQEHYIKVYIDGANDNAFCGTIGASSSLKINKNCTRFVKVEVQGGGTEKILNAEKILQERKQVSKDVGETDVVVPVEAPKKTDKSSSNKGTGDKPLPSPKPKPDNKQMTIEADEVIEAFSHYLDTTSYYSISYLDSLKSRIDSYIDAMKYMDQEHKGNYISEKQLNGYVTDAKQDLKLHVDKIDQLIEEFLSQYSGTTINDKQKCLDEMHKLVDKKLKEREEAIASLEEDLDDVSSTALINKFLNDKTMLMYFVLGIVALIVLFIGIAIFKKKKTAKSPTQLPSDPNQQNATADIVVRRKTTSILKKQSLEDVHNNPLYLKIDCAEFCEDSAVRRIYFKNTCIKDIYNMYAEDLKNPDNPNEDGCMVLGRWVHDSEADEYYVSLEEIVKPGDDAIFQEYELNFGGKIKLKVSEKLRKLRRDTNLQYDMTCWVHSHPGLGVFFSNADSSVQMQLKHPTHPKFLTALVIDILTPEQELGIFTFRHDMTINSKADLKKLYSFEEMYKWAVSSDRSSFKAEDYYNIMSTAQNRLDSCFGVQLSNGAIIEMCQMETEQNSGLLGWVQGFGCKKENKIEYVAKTISKEKVVPDNDAIGCFVIGTYRSIPTIRKIIATATNIHFVLFYSSTDGLLTAIPVVDGQLILEEKYYGEEKLEYLKIWTRRRR